MEFLEYGHNGALVAMSLLVALVAGFTGLSLTKNLSAKTVFQRKIAISLSAVALGGGIWSMHFVAMLGLKMPILFYYDAAVTLASALIAILVVAFALILLHFSKRTPLRILAAGGVVGVGILAMHYVGMAGLQLCRAVYTTAGVTLTSLAAIALCALAFFLAYNSRSNRNIMMGTLCFGMAVFAVHFLAMASTNFVEATQFSELGPSISNETLALGVIVSSFVIFGAFLWVGATYLEPIPAGAGMAAHSTSANAAPNAVPPLDASPPTPQGAPSSQPAGQAQAHPQAFANDRPNAQSAAPPQAPTLAPAEQKTAIWIPCERDSAKISIPAHDVAFVRADGHYTQVYTDTERYFCVWPITEAEKRLLPGGFVKLHRSYLGNPAKVQRFERGKDKGRLIFASDFVPPAPVSRSHLKDVQNILGAFGAA